MQPSRGQWGRFRLAFAVAALAQLPASAHAESQLTQIYRTPLKIVWATPLVAAPAVPAYAEGGPALVAGEEFSNEIFVSGTRKPGLQFSLNPVDEEVVLGWRFKF